MIAYILFVSCANSHKVKRDPISPVYQEKINAYGRRLSGDVRLLTDEKIKFNKLEIVNDSLYMVVKDQTNINKIHISEVKMIKFKDRIIGLTQGLYLWAAIGGVSLGLYSDNGEGGGALARGASAAE